MLRTILLGILAVLVVGIAFIASRPASFTVERSAEIAAPPEAVFALLNDFHQWGRWSPFTLAPAAGGTQVRWAMNGENGFVGKALSLVMNMDALVGKDFEAGLANLAAAAKSAP